MTETVEYRDPSATERKEQECIPVSATTKSFGAGWYSFSEDITINGSLALEGDVNLILADGATLTIKGGIAGEGYNLTVWGQEKQTGKLIVNGTNGGDGAVVEKPVAPSKDLMREAIAKPTTVPSRPPRLAR